MSKVYVYSTLTNSNRYGPFTVGGADLPNRPETVEIKGGAGIATKHFMTPYGVLTTITEEQLALCQADPAFQHHVKEGWIIVDTVQRDAENVAVDMAARDGSAPLVPQDVDEATEVTPVLNKEPAPTPSRRNR